jgi:hypothetical protein
MFVTKDDGSRRRGKPRLSWLAGVRKDLRVTKVKRWRQKAADR